jgi:hypothetical protein
MTSHSFQLLSDQEVIQLKRSRGIVGFYFAELRSGGLTFGTDGLCRVPKVCAAPFACLSSTLTSYQTQAQVRQKIPL